MTNPVPRSTHFSHRLISGLLALALSAGAYAQPRNFDIAEGDLKAALEAYAAQSGAQLIYKTEDVKGRRTKGLKRALPPEEALTQLLEGTSLSARRDAVTGAVVIFVTTPPPEKNPNVSSLDTVIVTATRRNEPVREVPMQVNSVSADALGRSGSRSLQDYMANEAGVDVKSYGGAGASSVSIRGVTTGSQTISTVGMYVDDVAFGSSSPFATGAQLALDMALLDLNHIEVLRGPQGTLYGAGAMGGLLKYVTNEPDTYELSGQVSADASFKRGGGPGYTVGAVVNAPLKEDVAGLRVSAFRDHFGGDVDGIGPAGEARRNRGDTTGARASLLIEPLRKLKFRLTATTQKIERDGTDFVSYDPATGHPVDGARERVLQAREPYRIDIDLFSADIEYDFGWARLNSITSHQTMTSGVNLDLSSAYVPILASLGLNLASTPASVDTLLHKTTQELRLTSQSDPHFEWLAGFYYDLEKTNNSQIASSTLVGGAPGPTLLVANFPAQYREAAAYGDMTWKFDSGIALTGGLRIARNHQDYRQSTSGLLAGGAQPVEANSSDTSRTWLLTARYALAQNSDVYVRAATGYRPGGPNAVLNDPFTGKPLAPNTFRPDSLTSIEAGYKADLLDKTLSLQTAVFDIRWNDLQQFMPVNGITVIVNAGAAHVKGAELSASWRPDKRWTLSANASAIDARLSEDAPGLGALAGARLPSSARFSMALAANYAFELASHASYAGLNARHVGDRTVGFDGSASLPQYRLPAYTMVDLQAGIDLKPLNLALFVRNVFDTTAQLAGNNAVQPYGAPDWVSLAAPRTFGFTLSAAF